MKVFLSQCHPNYWIHGILASWSFLDIPDFSAHGKFLKLQENISIAKGNKNSSQVKAKERKNSGHGGLWLSIGGGCQ